MKGSEFLKGASVLVTGSSGMLGRKLVSRLSHTNQVVGVSKSGKEGSLACDLTQKNEVEKLLAKPFDLVIHAAAYSDVDGCERDPKLAHESNAVATAHLAGLCGEKNTAFIYVSTDYVFDGRKSSPYKETDAVCPVNIYGMTKLEGEFFTARAGVSAIVRTSWLFGDGNPNSFVNVIIEKLKSEKVVRVLDDQEDSPTSTHDLSESLERVGEHLVSTAKSGKKCREVFQVCNSGSTTRYGMTQKIKDCLGLKSVQLERLDRNQIKNRLAVRPDYGVMLTSRYEQFFNTRLRPWQESLEDYLNIYI